jgi:hypothetical protein
MEISISNRMRNILIAGALLVLVAILIGLIAVPQFTGKSINQVIGLDSGRQTAISGAETFYTVDYQDGPDMWAARLCAISTEKACEVYQTIFAAKLWPGFEVEKTVTTATVTDAELISEANVSQRDGARTQVWKVTVSLSAPWPQSKSPDATFEEYVVVVQEEQVWKLERFLSVKEVQALLEGKNER